MGALETERVETPIGPMELVISALGVRRLKFLRGDPRSGIAPAPAPTSPVARRIHAFFYQAELNAFDGLSIDAQGTEFQHRVWDQLRKIPHGETASYGEIARRLGQPGASRAVGMANNANPVAVIVPCHRVIGADGSMIGFGAGIDRKRWLLAHEAALPPIRRRRRVTAQRRFQFQPEV